MVKEVNNITNIKLTESDTDGIWLHFEAEGLGLKAGVLLSTLSSFRGITNRAIEAWAREQLDRQKVAHRRFYLHPDPLPPAPRNEFLKEGNGERTDECTQ